MNLSWQTPTDPCRFLTFRDRCLEGFLKIEEIRGLISDERKHKGAFFLDHSLHKMPPSWLFLLKLILTLAVLRKIRVNAKHKQSLKLISQVFLIGSQTEAVKLQA